MITAIRLRERNKKLGFMMRSYTTAQGTKFIAGEGGLPSAVRIVTNPLDVAEAKAIAQFEILESNDERALAVHLRQEMESRSRIGAPPVTAQIVAQPGTAQEPILPAPVMALVTPTAIGEEEEEAPVGPPLPKSLGTTSTEAPAPAKRSHRKKASGRQPQR